MDLGLERWDARTGKWMLYADEAEHGRDCAANPFEAIPRRVFLDTSVVNLVVKNAATIFDLEPVAPELKAPRRREVEALLHLFSVGRRADWDLVASAKSVEEVGRTCDVELRGDLLDFVEGLVERDSRHAVHADDLGRRVADAVIFAALPDRDDRVLLANAVGLGCDAFVTADVRTIVSRRSRLPTLPLRVLTPVEWWRCVKPWAGLWG